MSGPHYQTPKIRPMSHKRSALVASLDIGTSGNAGAAASTDGSSATDQRPIEMTLINNDTHALAAEVAERLRRPR